MTQLIRRLASLRIAVTLLALIVIAMAAGTIVDSRSGPEVAGRLVYHALWFEALLALFALNVACSLVDLWPWGWRRAGFALTHGSMLIVLAGALVSSMLKVEGKLALWEGEKSSIFETEGPEGATGRAALPYIVGLDSFEIDYYQGTRRPAMFTSRVTVTDPATGRSFPAVIQMNHELAYGGYRLFQSSYQESSGRDQTILAVSRDPGQPIVFAGYVLLMAGMLTVLFTRAMQRRAAARPGAGRPIGIAARRVAALSLAASVAGGFAAPARAAMVPRPDDVETLRRLPVQHDGRVMPLDTLARETVWQVTSSRYSWEGVDPVALVLGWTLDPQGWASEPIVPIRSSAFAAEAGLPAGTTRASFRELVDNPKVLQLFERARAASEAGRPPADSGAALKEAQRVEERLIWMQPFLQKRGILAVPAALDPAAAWAPPAPADTASDFARVLRARLAGSSATEAAIEREIAYNRVRPARLSWWILVTAAAVSLAAWNRPRRWLDVASLVGLLGGFLAMTWGLATRWAVAGRIPASNMYESLLFLGWGVALFAVVALVFLRNRMVVFNAAAMSALTMLLADTLPLDPFIHPMPPVLSGTPWLAIHVPIIMVSYSVLALGVLVAHMQIGVEMFAPRRHDLAARMGELLYWYTHIGAILLIAGILTGSIWAASSWGRYWGWDPKEVWSLIAFLAYLAILHGRFDRLIGPFGVAALSIVAFWTILMTYVGVNFVLTTGLHAYGFGGTSVVWWMMLVALIEALFLLSAFVAHRSRAYRAA